MIKMRINYNFFSVFQPNFRVGSALMLEYFGAKIPAIVVHYKQDTKTGLLFWDYEGVQKLVSFAVDFVREEIHLDHDKCEKCEIIDVILPERWEISVIK